MGKFCLGECVRARAKRSQRSGGLSTHDNGRQSLPTLSGGAVRAGMKPVVPTRNGGPNLD